MSVYTKAGDKGNTKVFDRVSGQLIAISKTSSKIRSIGAIDELNSFLGIVISFAKDPILQKRLRELQSDLFTINAILAGGKLKFSKTGVEKLEKEIDDWEGMLSVQKNFIYYGGSRTSSLLFFARALCRRAERSLLKLQITNYKLQILAYLNRLSDWLFILARKVNFDEKSKEIFWISK
jgi:cob(I)alamin adenosyltransferase